MHLLVRHGVRQPQFTTYNQAKGEADAELFNRYLLGQAIGGIILPPYSECFGRKKLYIISSVTYSISCIIVAAVPSISGVVFGRLLGGFLSAIPSTIVVGSIEDMFNSRDRVWMIWIWALVANLGLVVGPIMGTFTTNDLNWYVSELRPLPAILG
jgi:MFS family permease